MSCVFCLSLYSLYVGMLIMIQTKKSTYQLMHIKYTNSYTTALKHRSWFYKMVSTWLAVCSIICTQIETVFSVHSKVLGHLTNICNRELLTATQSVWCFHDSEAKVGHNCVWLGPKRLGYCTPGTARKWGQIHRGNGDMKLFLYQPSYDASNLIICWMSSPHLYVMITLS